MLECPACGTPISEEVQRTTTRLLASLDAQRRARLTETYAGQAPAQLCAGCMNTTVSSLNQAMGVNQ